MAENQGKGQKAKGKGTEGPERPQASEVTELGHGRFLVNGRVAYAAGPPQARWVFLAGRVYVIDVQSSPRAQGGAHHTHDHGQDEDLALSSPMPATVAAVNVAPGQQVSRGDVLVTLEAMKMELPIRAPRDGRVARVACQPGQLVQAGVALVELE